MKEKNVSKPLFTFIVPAYNSADFIGRCIESVLNQTYPSFECIIIDDGSKDNTLAVSQSYALSDNRIRVIHKENGGQTSARNAGLLESKGEYIVFLDSDDWLDCDVLEKCYHSINTDSPDIIIYGLNSTATNKNIPNLVSSGVYNLRDTDNKIVDSIMMNKDGKNVFVKGLIGKVFKREIIWHNQFNVPLELRVAEDAAAFVGSVFDSDTITVIDDAIYHYYVREGSVSHSADAKALYRLPFMFDYYKNKLNDSRVDFSNQLERCIVHELYTAVLFVIRSGATKHDLNAGVNEVFKDTHVFAMFKQAKFTLKGYKQIIKKNILRYRLWWLAKLIDGKMR